MSMEGELVILREERLEDMPSFAALQNDLDTQGWGKTLPPDYTENMYIKRFEGREFSYDPKDARFVVVSKENGEFAGMISYAGLRPRWSVMIGIIMAKKFWGTGFAYDAQEVLLNFLFQELGLQVVRIYTNSGRPHAVNLAKKSGFVITGRQRQSVLRRGGVYDGLMMDLLREEYFAQHPQLVDNLPSPVG